MGNFGNLHRKYRGEKFLSLRNYCVLTGLDPGNVSRFERGLMPPPQNEKTLEKMADVFGLKNQERCIFINTAFVDAGRIPPRCLTDEEVLKSLPVILCCKNKPTRGQLEKLIKIIKEG